MQFREPWGKWKKIKNNFNLGLGLRMASTEPFRCCSASCCGNKPRGILSIRRTSPLISGRNHWSNARPSSHLEVGIFHLFSKADPLSNLCGLRLLNRLIRYGWFSLDCRYMVELRAAQRRRKEQRDKIWIAKIPFLADKLRSSYKFLYGRRKIRIIQDTESSYYGILYPKKVKSW